MAKLIAKADLERLPALYSQGDAADPTVFVKFFLPGTGWTWYATEGEVERDDDGTEDVRFFGLVEGLEAELGYFALSELEQARSPWGLKVERDLCFEPAPLSHVRTRRVERGPGRWRAGPAGCGVHRPQSMGQEHVPNQERCASAGITG